MAVYTALTEQEVVDHLTQYNLGQLVSLQPCKGGIENTNYFVYTTQGAYVLTLFERLTMEQLPFYVELTRTLAHARIAVPAPQLTHTGQLLTTLKGKPSLVVTCLPGNWVRYPGADHCGLVGHELARMHHAALTTPILQDNLRGLPWMQSAIGSVLPFIPTHLASLLQEEVAAYAALQASTTYQQLRRGPIHADLFRDNVLMTGPDNQPQLGGFFDFYFAGVDTWLFDVAVCINDWCIDHATGAIKPELAAAFLQAYAQHTPFTDGERQVWPAMLRAAALRFWLSRLDDFYCPRPAQTLTAHDPTHFERVLMQRRAGNVPALP